MKKNKEKYFLEETAHEMKWLEEFEASDLIRSYLQNYNSTATRNFIEHYLRQKHLWFRHPQRDRLENEDQQLRWINLAYNHLKIILQKKLFDAQCLWRAEQVSFNEIAISYDFVVWESNILNCPFIEPINENDLEQYIQYLDNNSIDTTILNEGKWQDHRKIAAAYNGENNSEFPDWYQHHNNFTGRTALLLLPDKKGDKEKFYFDLHLQEKKLQESRQIPNDRKNDNRPWMDYYNERYIKWFVTNFESKEVKSIYKEFSWKNRSQDKAKEILHLTQELLAADEPVAMESNADWHEALRNTVKNFRCKKVIEALPIVWEQYQMNIKSGIAFSTENKYQFDAIRTFTAEAISNGRKLNGEPEDLLF